VYAKVKANGSYSLATTIPTGRHGRYSVTGRCGGGTLGVTAHLSVNPGGSAAVHRLAASARRQKPQRAR
jgi:hypothetical protein